MNEELYNRLYELRKRLREREKSPSGVCTDASLAELARLAPAEKSELLYIKGLGRAFYDKYGNDFMSVLGDFHRRNRVPLAEINGGVREVLKNLENRLVNISRRNRLLFMPKLSGYSVDLCPSGRLNGQKLVAFLLKREAGTRLKVCTAADEKKFSAFCKLQREAERLKRETGEESLYIAYPFVTGRISGENFDIRAPLALFPAQLIINGDEAIVRNDAGKDILLNRSLVLTHYKFNQIGAPLPDEDIDADDFFMRLERYYKSAGIRIDMTGTELKPFTEYRAGEFPKYRSGELKLEQSAVLGLFSVYSGSIQRDFKNIIAGGKINVQLKDLLDDIEEVDIYSDSEEYNSPEDKEPKESELNYINDLNISQENAINFINEHDRLVVQGPPGTGKSQTITSMIADFVNKGKNVLMVSQKKAALDVIYSRLGKQSRYALLVNDVKDKDSFYEQLARIFASSENSDPDSNRFESVSYDIDSDLNKLDSIADRLYYDDSFAGVPMYRIYEENRENTFRSESAAVTEIYRQFITAEICNMGYARIKELKHYFDDRTLLGKLKEFFSLDKRFPWLKNVSDKAMTMMDIKEALAEIRVIVEKYVEVYSLNPVKRLFRKKEIYKPLAAFTKKYFARNRRALVRTFVKEPTELYNGIESYERYYTLASIAGRLGAQEKAWFGAVYNLSLATDAPLKEVNRRVFDFCALNYISEFEGANRDTLAALDGFDITVKEICGLIDEKKRLTRERLKAGLTRAYNENIAKSKRSPEMLRIIESKHRWSVARFIEKFGFELFKGIRIWLMTPETVSELLPLETGLFELLIFDEASQIYIEKGIPSIARAKKVVIAGDHKQLRPSSLGDGRFENDDDETAALDEESLLDLARFKYPEMMLNYHYRSRYEELIAFSNYAFYKGRLNISPNTDIPATPPIEVLYTPDGRWDDRRNAAEARKVVRILKKFFNERTSGETVGIITFNQAQRDLICDMIDEEGRKDKTFGANCRKEYSRTDNGEDVGLFIKNIENVQGDERDYIIFSLAYAKNDQGKLVRNFGWLNQAGGENRLNVAVSRAKKKITVVTSIRSGDLKADDLKNEGPRVFQKYLRYAEFVSAGNTEGAASVLKSFGNYYTRTYSYDDEFAFEVYRELSARGLKLQREVGIGGYKIDMAVVSDDGKYLLGIECDSTLYRRSAVSRERDVHLRRYLESRGWKLYRIWSSNWWKDAGREIALIKKAALGK